MKITKLFSRELTGLSEICISAIKECPPKKGSWLGSSAVLILMYKTKLIFIHFLKDSAVHWKMYLVHAFFSVRSGETFAKNNQLALRSRFKNCLVGN